MSARSVAWLAGYASAGRSGIISSSFANKSPKPFLASISPSPYPLQTQRPAIRSFSQISRRSSHELSKRAASRAYSTTPPEHQHRESGGSSLAWGLALAAVAAGGAWWYYTNQPTVPKEANVAKKIFQGLDKGPVTLTLDTIDVISPDTNHYRFLFDDPDAVSGLPVASAILIQLPPGPDGKPIVRPYTPVSDENDKGHLDLVVKKYPGGKVGSHLASLKPGDKVDFKGPVPKLPIKRNEKEHLYMVAGGTGVTPMYQVLRKIFSDPAEKTKVTLFYGNKTEDDILLRKELEDLENKLPQRFKVHWLLDNPPKGWKGETGYVTKELLQENLLGPDADEKIKILVCGPPGFTKAVSGPKKSPSDQGTLLGHLKDLDYKAEQVFKF